MMMPIKKEVIDIVPVNFTFPIYRSKSIGEYGFSGFEKHYYKIESYHKVTIITEKMCQTIVTTYDETNNPKDLKVCVLAMFMTQDMIDGSGEFDVISEDKFKTAIDRAINHLSKAI